MITCNYNCKDWIYKAKTDFQSKSIFELCGETLFLYYSFGFEVILWLVKE